jgi:hypothetical protein
MQQEPFKAFGAGDAVDGRALRHRQGRRCVARDGLPEERIAQHLRERLDHPALFEQGPQVGRRLRKLGPHVPHGHRPASEQPGENGVALAFTARPRRAWAAPPP